MTQVTQGDTAPCNTKKRGRNWSFTWNNYDNADIDILTQEFKDDIYIIGKEISSSGTPHLQGCIEFKNARTFSSLKNKFPKVHWELTKTKIGSRKYCSKDNNIITNIKIEKSLEEQYDDFMNMEYKDIVWKPWQTKVINIINQIPDRRTVYWFWEPSGNTGKSFLCKFIDWKYSCIIVNGKQNDVFNGIKTYLDSKNEYPKIVIIDIPRTNENYINYSTMEKIKDGLFYSGKYEGGVCRLLPLHLIVFANFQPVYTMLSQDRWHIESIE